MGVTHELTELFYNFGANRIYSVFVFIRCSGNVITKPLPSNGHIRHSMFYSLYNFEVILKSPWVGRMPGLASLLPASVPKTVEAGKTVPGLN
jgi:hypothetical protein